MSKLFFWNRNLTVAVGIVVLVPLVINILLLRTFDKEFHSQNSVLQKNLEIQSELSHLEDTTGETKLSIDDVEANLGNHGTRNASAINLQNPVGQPNRFLQEAAPPRPRTVYAAHGPAAVYSLIGTDRFDYPFACKCDPFQMAQFNPPPTTQPYLRSPVLCLSSGGPLPLRLFGSNKNSYCDATNSAVRISFVTAFIVPCIGTLVVSWFF